MYYQTIKLSTPPSAADICDWCIIKLLVSFVLLSRSGISNNV